MRLGFARGFIRIPEVKGNVFGLVSKLVLGSCLVNNTYKVFTGYFRT